MTLIYCGLNAIANQLDMTLGFVWPWGIPTAPGHLIIMMSWPLGTLFSDKLVFWCWNTSCWHCFYMSTFPSKPLDWRNKFSKTIIIPLAGNQDLRKGHVSQLVTQNIESMITWSWSLLRVRSRTLNTCHDYHHHQQHHQQHQHHHHHHHQHQQHHQPYDTLSSHLPPHCFGALAGMYIYIFIYLYICKGGGRQDLNSARVDIAGDAIEGVAEGLPWDGGRCGVRQEYGKWCDNHKMGVKTLKKYTFLDFLSWGTIIPLKFQNATCSAASYFVKMCWTYAQRHKDDLTPHV